uniref:C3H1-type domain-containing protein n=1 Tax=Panagrolaimus superbus TaxID=310955 RepID=A0A914Z5Z4_9BILA
MSTPFGMNFGNQNNYGNHFMGNRHHQHQQQQFHQRNINNFQQYSPPPSFGLPSALPSMPPFLNQNSMMSNPTNSPLSLSSDGSTKEETKREIFFRTLSASLKEANKFYSGKTTSWKNPFLYKTTICENYSNRSYCRFGVNCWYAHGPHELRCIPESEDLPDQSFISQYLSFLGLPSQTLHQIIEHSYYVANLLSSSESSWFTSSKKSASDLPSFGSTRCVSASNSPINNKNEHVQLSSDPVNLLNTPKPKNDKFFSSYTSNGGWGEIESAINGIVDQNVSGISGNNDFGKSFRLFGDSFNHQKRW